MLNHQLCAQLIGAALGRDGKVGDAGYRRKSFPSESERCDFQEVICCRDLARGVPLYRKHNIHWTHPDAIVAYDNQTTAAILDMDIDACCTGIHGILNQFFDDAAWTFDDFSSRNLVACVVIEEADRRDGIPDVAWNRH
jgi:hypothetical protein